jgi:hypothetical protein
LDKVMRRTINRVLLWLSDRLGDASDWLYRRVTGRD